MPTSTYVDTAAIEPLGCELAPGANGGNDGGARRIASSIVIPDRMLLPRVIDGNPQAPADFAPSKIVGIGQNYRAHAKEMGKGIPDEPVMFLKPPSALIEHGAAIERPAGYLRVDYEGELGVVIGRRARHVSVDDALGYVLGYVGVNDVTVRDLQQKDGQWTRAKGFDTFCPVGPVIAVGLDPRDLRITTRVNGAVKQDSRTSDLIFDVATLIAFVSRHLTLEAGDLISTGTPAGVGNLTVGDVVEVEIEGIGVLRNPVVAPRAGA